MEKIAKKLPVAKFYYKGTGQTDAQRTVILLDIEDDNKIYGYELRKGNDVFKLKNATVKSYIKSKISENHEFRRLTLLETLDEGI